MGGNAGAEGKYGREDGGRRGGGEIGGGEGGLGARKISVVFSWMHSCPLDVSIDAKLNRYPPGMDGLLTD